MISAQDRRRQHVLSYSGRPEIRKAARDSKFGVMVLMR